MFQTKGKNRPEFGVWGLGGETGRKAPDCLDCLRSRHYSSFFFFSSLLFSFYYKYSLSADPPFKRADGGDHA